MIFYIIFSVILATELEGIFIATDDWDGPKIMPGDGIRIKKGDQVVVYPRDPTISKARSPYLWGMVMDNYGNNPLGFFPPRAIGRSSVYADAPIPTQKSTRWQRRIQEAKTQIIRSHDEEVSASWGELRELGIDFESTGFEDTQSCPIPTDELSEEEHVLVKEFNEPVNEKIEKEDLLDGGEVLMGMLKIPTDNHKAFKQ